MYVIQMEKRRYMLPEEKWMFPKIRTKICLAFNIAVNFPITDARNGQTLLGLLCKIFPIFLKWKEMSYNLFFKLFSNVRYIQKIAGDAVLCFAKSLKYLFHFNMP